MARATRQAGSPAIWVRSRAARCCRSVSHPSTSGCWRSCRWRFCSHCGPAYPQGVPPGGAGCTAWGRSASGCRGSRSASTSSASRISPSRCPSPSPSSPSSRRTRPWSGSWPIVCARAPGHGVSSWPCRPCGAPANGSAAGCSRVFPGSASATARSTRRSAGSPRSSASMAWGSERPCAPAFCAKSSTGRAGRVIWGGSACSWPAVGPWGTSPGPGPRKSRSRSRSSRATSPRRSNGRRQSARRPSIAIWPCRRHTGTRT